MGHRHFSHPVGGVGQQHRAGDVACGVHPGKVGLHVFIYGNAAAVVVEARLVEAGSLNIGGAAGSQQHQIGLDRLRGGCGGCGGCHGNLYRPGLIGSVGDLRYSVAQLVLHAGDLLTQRLRRGGREHRNDLVGHFYHGHRGAHRGKIRGKLHSDVTAAYHHQSPRELGNFEDLPTGQYFGMTIRSGNRWLDRASSGGQEDVVTGEFLPVNRDPPGSAQRGGGGAYLHAMLFHLRENPFLQRFDRLGLVRHRRGQIVLDSRGGNPKGLGVPGLVVELGAIEQRLGGDTALVKADAANLGLLHQQHPFSQSPRAFRGNVAGGSAADND